MTREFLGRGFAFPFLPDDARRLRLVSGEDRIRQSLWIILSTAPGELLMRPTFGCGIHDLVFEPNSGALRGMVAARVREALTRWEPRIDLLDVRVDSDNLERNHLFIGVDYRIRSNNAFYNLVYPYFVNEGVGFPTEAGVTADAEVAAGVGGPAGPAGGGQA